MSELAPSSPPPAIDWTTRLRWSAGGACLLVAAGLGGLAVAEHARASRPPVAVAVAVEGRAFEGDVASFAERIASEWEATPMTLAIADEELDVTRAALGATVDRDALARALTQATDPQSLMRRYHLQTRGAAEALDLTIPFRFEATELVRLLTERKDRLDTPSRDARIEPRTGRIQPEQVGRRLDVYATVDATYRALASGAARVDTSFVEERPLRRANELRDVRVGAVLGAFETHYSTLETAANRTYNLHVAASKVDGYVLLPGETFDFNAVVGERNEANGFRPAPEIADGELVDGIGGGTCQIAGTLHAATFFSGLPIVERSPHSRPSSYIWMGLDAVVVYPRLNLRFTNDFPFPVVLGMTVEGGIVRAELRGPESDRMVTFTRRVDRIEPFLERTVDDPSLPAGVRVLRQRGVPGFRITRFRIARDVEHNHARRTRWQDTYPPTDQIWRVGTGPAAAPDYVPPEGDAHPEYTADELLSASFGATVDGLQITRRAGRSGTPGWTVREGMTTATP